MAKNLLAICLMFMVASSVVYEVQGHFLLKLYLRRKLFPRRCVDFTPYACKGMLMLVGNLEGGCPATREFKQFFSSFRAYLNFISSVSVSSSSNIDVQLNGQANSLFKSCKILQALRGQRSSSDFESTMMSMGKTLIEQKRSGSIFMSFSQRRQLVLAMVQWTKILATFVQTAAEQSGKSIDISNYGLDVDVNRAVGGGSSPSDESSSPRSRSSPTPMNSGSYPTPATPSNTGSYPTPATPSNTGSSPTPATPSTTGSSPTPATPSTTGSSPTPATPSTTGSSPTPATPSTTGSSPTPTTPSTTGSSPTPTTPTTSGSVDQSASSTKTRSGSKTKETSGGSIYSDTTGSKPETPSGSPTPDTTTSSGSSKKKESASGSSQKTESSGKANSDTTPSTSTPTPSSTSPTTSSSGSENKESKSASQTASSSSTSVKQVETETSSEVMSFISELEKKYTSNAELKVFFDKLKASMSATSKISTANSQDLVSGMRAAAGKLSEAMMFVRSRFSKSEETKTTMESCQEQVMNSVKELQEINKEIASAKTVTSTQKTELKQTLTKWEQVTTQFVETAASSSSTSSSSTSSKSQQTSGSSQKQQTSQMNSQAS